MQSPGWTETYMETLDLFSPPNLGVVGPSERTGKPNILTFDFVHR